MEKPTYSKAGNLRPRVIDKDTGLEVAKVAFMKPHYMEIFTHPTEETRYVVFATLYVTKMQIRSCAGMVADENDEMLWVESEDLESEINLKNPKYALTCLSWDYLFAEQCWQASGLS